MTASRFLHPSAIYAFILLLHAVGSDPLESATSFDVNEIRIDFQSLDKPYAASASVTITKIDEDENDSNEFNDSQEWWRTASFYQIYPRSFMDSNGDGIGDLNGIAAKLPYLKDIGITATWLSPIFKSPMFDFGYDIANYFDIQPEYGTLDDFDNLIAVANKLGLKIVLDFVPNHTSDEHEWFRLSEQRDEHFVDFYVWHPGHVDPANPGGPRKPPTNWMSIFEGSAWQFSQRRQEFYLHQFGVKQPDLNYRNPKVVEMMHSVLRFWLNRGVAGFRVDAVPYLFEVRPNDMGDYPDEALSGYTNDTNDYNYVEHKWSVDQSETLDMVYQWRSTLDEFQRRNGGDVPVMLTEAYSPIEVVMRYYGDGNGRDGSQIPFNFGFIGELNNRSTAYDYQRLVDRWLERMPAGRTPNWVAGNHDQHRVAARLGTDRIDAINMLLLTLPGISITYNGEEIGMVDTWISWNDTVDPAACNTNATVYENFSRDPERTPFQWDDSTSAGFSVNNKTWLPVADNYRTVNVKTELAAANSHLVCYRKLMQLRQTMATFKRGGLLCKAASANVLVLIRSLKDEHTFVTVINVGPHAEQVNLQKFEKLPARMRYAVVGVSSAHQEGESVNTDNVTVEAYESFVLWTQNPTPPAPTVQFFDYVAKWMAT